jgi:hypothetical protein
MKTPDRWGMYDMYGNGVSDARMASLHRRIRKARLQTPRGTFETVVPLTPTDTGGLPFASGWSHQSHAAVGAFAWS